MSINSSIYLLLCFIIFSSHSSAARNNYNGRSVSQYILAGLGKESYTSTFFNSGCRYYQVVCMPASGKSETALPETWNAWKDNSQNQFMLGHIMEWFCHDLAGIQFDPSKPWFKHVLIRPQIISDLTVVKGSYNSIHGKILSEWERISKKLILHIVIPPNSTATINIPTKAFDSITEGGKPLDHVSGISVVGWLNNYAVVKSSSGDYSFSSIIN